jgi:hypothetical protein
MSTKQSLFVAFAVLIAAAIFFSCGFDVQQAGLGLALVGIGFTSNPRIYFDPNEGCEYLIGQGPNGEAMRQKIWRDPFIYTFPVYSNLAVAASLAQTIVIAADSDFEWIAGAYNFSLANAAFTVSSRPVPNGTVLVTDLGSGRQLQNNPVPVEHWFGSADDDPYELPLSKVFTRNATIQITFTNTDAAVTTGQLRLSMLGYKIFYYGG